MSDEQRCRTCRWWRSSDEDRKALREWNGVAGEWVLPTRFAGWGSCGRAHEWDEAAKFVAASEDYCGPLLLTAPDFGCVQWEAAE